MSFAPSFFDHLEDRFNLAVYDTNQEHAMGRTAVLRGILRDVPGIESLRIKYIGGLQFVSFNGDTIELNAMASNEEIITALAKIDASIQRETMSVTGLQPGAIRAKLDGLKQKAADRRTQALSRLDGADAKLASVDAAIEQVAAQMEKEADDGLQEFAEFTNGGPA